MNKKNKKKIIQIDTVIDRQKQIDILIDRQISKSLISHYIKAFKMGQLDRKTNRHAGKQTDIHIDRHINIQTDIKIDIYIYIDRKTDRYMDKKTDRQIP